MSKTRRDRPSKRVEIEREKKERGDHRKMEPYKRSNKQSYEDEDN